MQFNFVRKAVGTISLAILTSVVLSVSAQAATTAAYVQASAQADASTFTYGGAWLDNDSHSDSDYQNSGMATISQSASSGPAYANASASAGFGSLHAYSSGYSQVYGSGSDKYVSGGQANASASFYDSWTIGVPGMEGQSGTATFTCKVSGSLSGAGFIAIPSRLSAGAGLSFNGTTVWSVGENNDWTVDPSGETVTFSTSFTYGQPFYISMQLDTRASGLEWINAPSVADFSNTAELVGVDFLDSNGVALKEFQFAALSNYDYEFLKKDPVVTPEPASMVLFGLGGAAMAFARRRKA